MARRASRPASPRPPSPPEPAEPLPIERVQTGVRLERRLLKVLKAVAEYHDVSLGELLEEVVLHAFVGESNFGPQSRARIDALCKVYGLDYGPHATARFTETASAEAPRGR